MFPILRPRTLLPLLLLVVAAPALSAPVVELIETRPVESGLGNPALPTAHEAWLEMLKGAKQSIDIEEFYLSTWPGEPMDDVLDAIGVAAARGVKVRFLLDAGLHRTYPMPADSIGKLKNVALRIIDYKRIAGGVQHSKYFLVDGRETVLGSQNFDWRSLKHIHELGVRIRDPRVTAEFERVFELDWRAAADSTVAKAPVPQHHTAMPFRFVQAPGDTLDLWTSWTPNAFNPDTTRWDRDAITSRIDGAQREVVVQVLTYATASRGVKDDAIDAALRRAAARGVKVKLLASDWESGAGLAAMQELAHVPNIEAKLGTVPEWSGGYIPFARVEHCKYMVVDSTWTWVGTDNWSPDYFHGTRNLAVTMRNVPMALQARAIFETSWTAPGAAPVHDGAYEPKVRGETPPPGKTAYGK